jgi:hypothetical protein
MTYLEGGLIVLATGGLAALMTLIVHRRFHIDALRRHHEIGSPVFLQMGVVFAVLLAFVFNQVWSEYNAADEAIARECGNMRVAALMAGNLPEPAGHDVRVLITAYLSSVITDEWPAMAHRQDSLVTETRLRELALGVTRLPGNDPQEAQTRDQIISLLRNAQQHRETRLYQMTSGIPGILWVMLGLFSVALVGFLFFFGMDSVSAQMLFTGVFAGSIALLLVILSLLNYPFEGAMALQPTAFVLALEHVAHLH